MTIGSVLALVVLLGLAGAGSASASPPTASETAAVAAVPARAAVACSEARVPAGYYNQDVFVDPNACSKCQFAGVGWELKGGYKAFCKHFPDGTYPTAWLYIKCLKCRDEAPTAAPVGRAGLG
jgi:hypothetical protein